MTKGARGLAQSRPAGRALALVLTATSKCCPRCFHLWEMLVLHVGSPVTSAARTDVASRGAPIPPWPSPTPAILQGARHRVIFHAVFQSVQFCFRNYSGLFVILAGVHLSFAGFQGSPGTGPFPGLLLPICSSRPDLPLCPSSRSAPWMRATLSFLNPHFPLDTYLTSRHPPGPLQARGLLLYDFLP